MTPARYLQLLEATGLTVYTVGPWLGGSRQLGWRWSHEGPPPPAARLLDLMAAQGLTAGAVDNILQQTA